jgi:hypothetical protein
MCIDHEHEFEVANLNVNFNFSQMTSSDIRNACQPANRSKFGKVDHVRKFYETTKMATDLSEGVEDNMLIGNINSRICHPKQTLLQIEIKTVKYQISSPSYLLI